MAKRSAKLLLVVLIAAWVGVLLTAGDSSAQLYRYVDKNGNVVLTDNPPTGVVAEAIEKEAAVSAPSSETSVPKSRPPQSQSAKPAPSPKGDDQIKEEADKTAEKVAKEEAEKETKRIMAEEEARKQAERERRLEEADRLEAEAKKPLQPTQENIDRQTKLMQEAQRLRDMQ
ncbi:MAG TPA: DUF4124 domain-containing protein [Syntrophales bacterium]|nr:DUF4124 domain-containing protein [Syntrophales bacterium]